VLSFDEARTVARAFGMDFSFEYVEAYKSGQLPISMPLRPDMSYRDKGWTGWANFLGTDSFRAHSEASKRGLERARASGKRLGRPSVSPERLLEAQSLREQGLSYAGIAQEMGVSRSYAFQLVTRYGVD